MKAISINQAGQHYTFVEREDLASALQTKNWRTGAILDDCQAIEVAEGALLKDVRFVGVSPDRQKWLAALVIALSDSGPVNVGLTSERGGLRVVLYFADEAMTKRRMNIAIQAISQK